jgi:hypothetical protein
MRRPSGYVVGKSKGGHHQRLLTSMRRQEQCGQEGKGGHQHIRAMLSETKRWASAKYNYKCGEAGGV